MSVEDQMLARLKISPLTQFNTRTATLLYTISGVEQETRNGCNGLRQNSDATGEVEGSGRN